MCGGCGEEGGSWYVRLMELSAVSRRLSRGGSIGAYIGAIVEKANSVKGEEAGVSLVH